MKILVTGATGFVGKHLCAELQHQGFSVRIALRSARPTDQNLEQVLVESIDGETDWTDALLNIDVVIHLAARAHILKKKADDSLDEYLKVNLLGTENLARQAAQCGVKRLVYVSSIGVNGSGTDGRLPFSENDEPDPHSPYALSKWQAESGLKQILKGTGLEATVVRPPLIYGAEAPGNFARMLRVLARNIPLPFASVHNTRSLIYVKNLVSALILCATHPAAGGQTYLVSDGEDVSTRDLLRLTGNAMGCPAKLFPCPTALLRLAGFLAGKENQMLSLLGSLQVDNSKIRRELDWKPPYTLRQGLQETGEWYRNTHL